MLAVRYYSSLFRKEKSGSKFRYMDLTQDETSLCDFKETEDYFRVLDTTPLGRGL